MSRPAVVGLLAAVALGVLLVGLAAAGRELHAQLANPYETDGYEAYRQKVGRV